MTISICDAALRTGRKIATYREEPRKWRNEYVRCQKEYDHLGRHEHEVDESTKYEWAGDSAHIVIDT